MCSNAANTEKQSPYLHRPTVEAGRGSGGNQRLIHLQIKQMETDSQSQGGRREAPGE